MNCPNCGAPITGHKCEYCGTVFDIKAEQKKMAEDSITIKLDFPIPMTPLDDKCFRTRMI